MDERTWKCGMIGGMVLLAAGTVLLMRGRFRGDQQTVYYNIMETNVQSAAEIIVPQTTQSRSVHTTHITAAASAEQAEQSYNTTETPDYNLNTADAAALQSVSGVGDILADAIVQHRAEIGGFTRRAQLLEIDGIGETLAVRITERFAIPDELPPDDPPAQEVPAGTELLPETAQTAEPDPAPLYFDANTVTREELLRIPKMTEPCADAILAVRDEIGGFSSIYELLGAEPVTERYFADVLRVHLYVQADQPMRDSAAE